MQLTTKLTLKKHKNKIFGGIAVILVIWLLVWAAQPPEGMSSTAEAVVNGTLSAEEQSHDFGMISMAAGKVSHLFKIKNTGSEPVMMRKLSTSCMCTTATLEVGGEKLGPYGMPGHGIIPTFSKALSPDEEATVEVTFDPAAHGPAGVGRISRVVYLDNNAGKPLELKFSATVTP